MEYCRFVFDEELYHHGILGQKWGVRRYQNPDGSLTDAGERRYAAAVAANNRKKAKDRVEESSLIDPDLWVRNDIKGYSKLSNEASKGVNDLKRLIDKTGNKKPQPRKQLDLSNMSDKELRDEINRTLLEKQYNDMFNPQPQTVNKGKEIVKEILDIGGSTLMVTSSALGIALALKELGL